MNKNNAKEIKDIKKLINSKASLRDSGYKASQKKKRYEKQPLLKGRIIPQILLALTYLLLLINFLLNIEHIGMIFLLSILYLTLFLSAVKLLDKSLMQHYANKHNSISMEISNVDYKLKKMHGGASNWSLDTVEEFENILRSDSNLSLHELVVNYNRSRHSTRANRTPDFIYNDESSNNDDHEAALENDNESNEDFGERYLEEQELIYQESLKERLESDSDFHRDENSPQWMIDEIDDSLERNWAEREFEDDVHNYQPSCDSCGYDTSSCRCCNYCDSYPCQCCENCSFYPCRCA